MVPFIWIALYDFQYKGYGWFSITLHLNGNYNLIYDNLYDNLGGLRNVWHLPTEFYSKNQVLADVLAIFLVRQIQGVYCTPFPLDLVSMVFLDQYVEGVEKMQIRQKKKWSIGPRFGDFSNFRA